VFERTDDTLGRFAVRPVDPDADAALLHRWVTHPKAAFWQMLDADVDAVVREYREIDASSWHEAFVGLHEDRPASSSNATTPRTTRSRPRTRSPTATSACTSSWRRPTGRSTVSRTP
jgi:hypothetical protein